MSLHVLTKMRVMRMHRILHRNVTLLQFLILRFLLHVLRILTLFLEPSVGFAFMANDCFTIHDSTERISVNTSFCEAVSGHVSSVQPHNEPKYSLLQLFTQIAQMR